MQGVPLVVLANKQDLINALPAAEVSCMPIPVIAASAVALTTPHACRLKLRYSTCVFT